MMIDNSPAQRPRPVWADPIRWILVAMLALAAFLVLWFARNQLVAPIDGFVTEQLCDTHGEEIGRVLADYERSNRFGLRNRSEGFCHYGPGDNGEPALSVPFSESIAGPMLTGTKVIGIILQLGVVSIFLRFVTDPAMNAYGFVRSRLQRA